MTHLEYTASHKCYSPVRFFAFVSFGCNSLPLFVSVSFVCRISALQHRIGRNELAAG